MKHYLHSPSIGSTAAYVLLTLWAVLCMLPRPASAAMQMHRIVISRQTPDALLGLPGVLCVIGSSREKGHEKADIPVHVFGPEGTCEFLSTMYDVSGRLPACLPACKAAGLLNSTAIKPSIILSAATPAACLCATHCFWQTLADYTACNSDRMMHGFFQGYVVRVHALQYS